MSLTLTIRLSNGTKFDTTISSTAENATVLQLKDHLSTLSETENCPRTNQRLIYKGRILDNDRTLSDYGIMNQCTLFLVKSSTTAKPASAAAATSTNTVAATAATSNTSVTPAPQQAQPLRSPMTFTFPPSTSGNASGGGTGMNPSSPFGLGGAGMGMGGMNDPSEVLNNPFVQNMLDSNPDFLRNVMRQQIENNPALQQLMDSNPAVRHMFNDPNQFDEMIRMMRNPAAMQQAMRSQDLALSQIENMPGGFAALSNMYETMQRPLEDSLAEQRSGSTREASNNNPSASSASNEGATGAAMPNPWGNSAPLQPPARTSATANNAGTTNNPFTSPTQNPLLANLFGGNAAGQAPGMNTTNPFSMMMGGGGSTGMMGNRGMPSLQERQAALQTLHSDPAMFQMMQQAIRANPSMFRQMISTQQDPMTAMLFQNMSDEQFANVLIEMMNPANMNRMMQMEQQLRGLEFGGGGGTSNPTAGSVALPPQPSFNPWASNSNNSTSTSTAAVPGAPAGGSMPGLDFSSLLFGPSAARTGGGNLTNTNNIPPAERYQVQLRSLYDMGFDDEIRNITALQAVHGNLNRAVDMLLSNEVPETPAAAVAPSTSTSAVAAPSPSSSAEQTVESSSSPPLTDETNEDLSGAEDQQPKDLTDKKND